MKRWTIGLILVIGLAACTSGSSSTATSTPASPRCTACLTPLSRVQVHSADELFYISMNVAQPPLDDIHVRKAVEYAIDKSALQELQGGPITGEIATHIFPNSLEGNALKHYDPYHTRGALGGRGKAMAEMAKSKYDPDHDGICDVSLCRGISTVWSRADPFYQQALKIAFTLRPLGLYLGLIGQFNDQAAECLDPRSHVGLCLSVAWSWDYPDALTFAQPMFASSSIGPAACCNYSLLGAAPGALDKIGYRVRQVPNVDDRIASCAILSSHPRTACWAELDRYLMEKVVPVVPYLFANTVNVLSKRVACYSFDQFTGEVALDHVCLAPSVGGPP